MNEANFFLLILFQLFLSTDGTSEGRQSRSCDGAANRHVGATQWCRLSPDSVSTLTIPSPGHRAGFILCIHRTRRQKHRGAKEYASSRVGYCRSTWEGEIYLCINLRRKNFE